MFADTLPLPIAQHRPAAPPQSPLFALEAARLAMPGGTLPPGRPSYGRRRSDGPRQSWPDAAPGDRRAAAPAPHPDAGSGLQAMMDRLRGPLAAVLDTAEREEAAPLAMTAWDQEPPRPSLFAVVEDLLAASIGAAAEAPLAVVPTPARVVAWEIVSALAEQGLRCGLRNLAAPDHGFRADGARLARAMELLAAYGRANCAGPARAELSVTAGREETVMDLVVQRVSVGSLAPGHRSRLIRELPLAIARRLIQAQGHRIDIWAPPGTGLRARIGFHAA